MKYAFYLLILCNVVFYLWETGPGRERPDPARDDPTDYAASERIVLIKELPEIPKKPPEAKAEEPPTETEHEAAQQMAEPLLTNPQLGVVGGNPRADGLSASAATDCYLMGPYQSESAARNTLNALQSQVQGGQVVAKDGEVQDGYWVLYPKAENLDVGRANRKMLIDQGLRDVWLIDKGELQGAISLGLFKTRERAEMARRQFSERNIAAEVQPRMIRARTSWLQLRWQGERAKLDALFSDLVAGHPERQASRLTPCD